MPNELMIHRTKLENADALYEKHAGELLTPPGKDHLDEFPELTAHTFTIKEGKTDIVFPDSAGSRCSKQIKNNGIRSERRTRICPPFINIERREREHETIVRSNRKSDRAFNVTRYS